MPSNTTYNPPNVDAFTKSELLFDAQGVSTTIPAGQTANLDYLLTDDCMITGAWILTNNGNFGDKANLQIIDTNGTYSGTPGTVLNQFVTNWYLPPSEDVQLDSAYPAKIYAGLTLRVTYTSTGTQDVFLAINWKLHKVLS